MFRRDTRVKEVTIKRRLEGGNKQAGILLQVGDSFILLRCNSPLCGCHDGRDMGTDGQQGYVAGRRLGGPSGEGVVRNYGAFPGQRDLQATRISGRTSVHILPDRQRVHECPCDCISWVRVHSIPLGLLATRMAASDHRAVVATKALRGRRSPPRLPPHVAESAAFAEGFEK